MPNAKLSSYLQLHFIVFIWGFTAILGELITISAIPLVLYRMSMASAMIWLYLSYKRISLFVSFKILKLSLLGGFLIALHWVTFFHAIKVSNVSITLSVLSSGAFFTSLFEPLFYKRKLVGYEVLFGILIIIGVYLIFRSEQQQSEGVFYALISALLSSFFTLLNGKLAGQARSSVISLYELGFGTLIIGVVVFISNWVPNELVKTEALLISKMTDWLYLFILASICTAYAFIIAVKVMRYLSPFSVMLTTNLEPVYGIFLALLFFGDSEKMTASFYFGALLILITVIANGILKKVQKQQARFNSDENFKKRR